MSINPSSARDITVWCQLQSGGARTINNTTGTWNNAGAQRLRFDTFDVTRNNPVSRPTYKTGLRSQLKGARGRQSGTWRLSKPLIPSGTTGVAPEDSNIIQAFMGAAGTIVNGTSVTYNLSDALNFLTFLRFNKTPGLTSPTNQYVIGGIAQSVKLIMNQDFMQYEVDGISVGIGDSQTFNSYAGTGDSVLLGGLTAFPTEPGSFANLGDVIPGYGSGAGVTVGGSTLAELRGSLEVDIDLGVEPIADGVNDQYPIGFVGGTRVVGINRVQCVDSDGTVLNALKAAAFNKTPENVVFTFGSVAGSIVIVTLKGVQFGSQSWQENGAALDISFDKSDAAASSTTVTDELTIQFD